MNIEEKKTQLLNRLLESDRYKKALGGLHKYKHPHGDYGDIVGIFNEGLMMGLEAMNLNIGDPMEYLIYRGYAYMRTQVRNECNRSILQECSGCGKIRPFRSGKCSCGCSDFIHHSRMTYIVIDDGEATIPFTSYPSDFMRLCRGCAKSRVDDKNNIL